MRLRDAAKWIKEKITGKKTEETPVLTPMIATEEYIEKAKEMDREIEEMEKKSALMTPIVVPVLVLLCCRFALGELNVTDIDFCRIHFSSFPVRVASCSDFSFNDHLCSLVRVFLHKLCLLPEGNTRNDR